jgi:hypothetical protein
VEQILSAFSQEGYWRARLSEIAGLDTLEQFTVGSDGAVAVTLTRNVRHPGQRSSGPSLIGKFLPVSWRVVQTEEWRPIGQGCVQGDLTIIAHGTPGSAAGSALIMPAHNGSRLTGSGAVRFDVPLIGGQVENLMGRTLTQSISTLQDFTTQWIRKHA